MGLAAWCGRQLGGGNCFPGDGEEAILEFAALAVDGPAFCAEHFLGAAPAVEGAEGSVAGGGCPGVVGSVEEVVDFLAGYVAVNEGFGEPFGHI